MLMVDYANFWSKDVNSQRLDKYRSSRMIGQLELKHLEHFYELLEEKTSEIVLRHIEVCYAQPISSEFRNSSLMTETITCVGGNGRLLLSTLTRFLVRYLRKPSSISPRIKFVNCSQLLSFAPWECCLSLCENSLREQWSGITVGQSVTILKELKTRVLADEEANRAMERLNFTAFHKPPSLKKEFQNPAVAKPLRSKTSFRA
jgi:hypothetical protein